MERKREEWTVIPLENGFIMKGERMRAEDICFEYGSYSENCNCDSCEHQYECSGREEKE